MARFEVKQSTKLQLTSYSDLALIGQCFEAAQLEAFIDPRVPVTQGMRTSGIVKSTVGLLSLGKSDFEAIETLNAFSSKGTKRGLKTARRCPGATKNCSHLKNGLLMAVLKVLCRPFLTERGIDELCKQLCCVPTET